MKRGFTLIELLAVIIILAIVALIATPIILDVIETAEKSAAESETQLILGSIEKGCATAQLAVQLDNPDAEDVAANEWCMDGTGDAAAVIASFTNLGDATVTATSVSNGRLTGSIVSKGYTFTVAAGVATLSE